MWLGSQVVQLAKVLVMFTDPGMTIGTWGATVVRGLSQLSLSNRGRLGLSQQVLLVIVAQVLPSNTQGAQYRQAVFHLHSSPGKLFPVVASAMWVRGSYECKHLSPQCSSQPGMVIRSKIWDEKWINGEW